MIKKILIGIFVLLSIYGVYQGFRYYKWKKETDRRNSYYQNLVDTSSPTVTSLRDSILIPYQNEKRTIHIYVPPSYLSDSLRSYPVIYMMDGEQCFNDLENNGPEWQLDEVINQADSTSKNSSIVVAIAESENRDQEYTPWPIKEYPDAHGDQYAKWVSYELKPWIDSLYRTKTEPEHTSIGGISRSGMMAYYFLMAHPDVWGNALIQSPSMWVDTEKLMAMEIPDIELQSKKIFISVGEKEDFMVQLAKVVFQKFKEKGLSDDRLKFEIIKGEGHWHLTWRKSFAKAYPWLMN